MRTLAATFGLFFCIGVGGLIAQCDTTAFYANQYLSEPFVSDGQQYRALIYDDQIAEFRSTFYANSNYRIVAFSGMEKSQIQFSLYDQENNLLFTNKEFQNEPYWDFKFESTMECRIEAQLDLTKQKSGCAVLLIGFER